MMSKIQNLNGTHNISSWASSSIHVVYDVKDTKFEWNSQRMILYLSQGRSCLWCQRYKIWMELTTLPTIDVNERPLFMMSKIQNLNGTHNKDVFSSATAIVVYDVKDTKFEWNSQPDKSAINILSVVYDVKDTKFEWNSQPMSVLPYFQCVVYDVKDTKFEWNSQQCYI